MRFSTMLLSSACAALMLGLLFTTYLIKNGYVLKYRDGSYMCSPIKE